MYTNDKKQRITLRLNDEQFFYVKNSADLLSVSPSEYLRMVISLTMKLDKQAAEKINKIMGETAGRENDKTDINDIIQQ